MTIIVTFVLNSGLNFVLGLLVAKFLGPEEFGRYAIAVAIAIIVNATLLDWLRLSASRFYSDKTRQSQPAVRATLDLAHGSISLTLMLLLVLAVVLGLDLRLPTALAAGAAGFGVCSGLFDYHAALARARFREGTYATLVIVKNVMAFALMAGGAFLFQNASVVLAGAVLSIAVAIGVARRALMDPGLGFRQAQPRLALEYARYAVPLVAAIAIYLIPPFTNRAAIASLYGFAEAGYFSLAADLGVRLFGAAGSALDIMLFQIAVRADELHGREEAERQIRRNAAIVLAVLLPTAAGYWLILPSFSALFVPQAFRQSFSLYTTLLMPGLLAFGLIQYAINPIFQLAKRTAPVVAAALVALAVNVALSIVLPPRVGPLGFALAQSGGMLAALVTAFALASRVSRLAPSGRDLAGVTIATALMIGALAPLRHLEPRLALPLIVAAGALIYVTVIATFDVGGLRRSLGARFMPDAGRPTTDVG